MADWQTLSTEVVYETPWIKVNKDQVRTHNDKEITYSYLSLHAPSVQIIPVDSQGRILLQKIYRYPIKQTIWEIPCGHSDGEDLLHAAKRELLEETGLSSDKWTSLGSIQSACGVADINAALYSAEDVRLESTNRDEDEAIGGQSFFTLAEVRGMIEQNEIVDAETLVGLYKYMMLKEA